MTRPERPAMKTRLTLLPRLLPLSLALALGGCAALVQTPYQTPEVQIPAHWQTASPEAGSIRDDWWSDFGDTTLDQLVAQALARNNDLAAAALKLRTARLQADLATSDLRPSVSGSLSSSAQRSLRYDTGTTISHSAQLGVGYEVDLWGRLGSLRDAKAWEAMATEQDRQSTRLALIGSTATLYWQVAYLKQRLDLSQASIAYVQRTLQLVEVQYKAGAASQLEVLSARQSLAAQEASDQDLRRQLAAARNALAILFDAPPGQNVPERDRLPEAALPVVPAGLPASLLGRRPDLRAAELRLRETLASSDAVRESYYPSLSLTGTLGSASTTLGRVLTKPVGLLGAGLDLPFLNWNQRRLDIAVAETEYATAVVSFRQTLYQALADVEDALSARSASLAQGEKLAQSLDYARRTEALYEVRYRAGAASLKDWLDAQETRRQAEISLAENRYNALVAQITVYQALGGSAAAQPGSAAGTAPAKDAAG